jgi:hypothetical protein
MLSWWWLVHKILRLLGLVRLRLEIHAMIKVRVNIVRFEFVSGHKNVLFGGTPYCFTVKRGRTKAVFALGTLLYLGQRPLLDKWLRHWGLLSLENLIVTFLYLMLVYWIQRANILQDVRSWISLLLILIQSLNTLAFCHLLSRDSFINLVLHLCL